MTRARRKPAKPLPVSAPDAVEMLVADHKKLKKLFDEYHVLVETDDANTKRKDDIVRETSDLLSLHTMVEERIFYPALRRATGEEEAIDEARVEHETMQELVDQLRLLQAGDELYDAKFIVLGEIFELHAAREEKGFFKQARKSRLDLHELGEKMLETREEFIISMRVSQTVDDINTADRDKAAPFNVRTEPGDRASFLVPPPGLR